MNSNHLIILKIAVTKLDKNEKRKVIAWLDHYDMRIPHKLIKHLPSDVREKFAIKLRELLKLVE